MVSLLHARTLNDLGECDAAIANAKRALDCIAARGYPMSARFAGTRAIELVATPAFTAHYNDAQTQTLATILTQIRAQMPQLGRNASAINESAPSAIATHHESISPREMEVLELIAAGESNKIIARRLDLSPHTVKRHVANILGKLGVDSRGQAAARYRELIAFQH
jgi:LuxR family transcriptional regulator, maltose regulon positive regulatory protein